jgi:hypothetical protein
MSQVVVLTENEIYERMVETILDHRLPPGSKRIEHRLATAFGVSRTLIRPVLVRLAKAQPPSDASRFGCQEHRALLSQLQFSQANAHVPDLRSLFGSESATFAEA